MANEAQVALLKQGSEVWNKWREENPELYSFDLSGTDFSGVDLRGVDLSFALLKDTNFSGARLQGANFSSARLCKANLTEGNLTQVDLSSANLENANFSKAKMARANMALARLFRTNLSNTDLRYTRLNNAFIFETDFASADLREASFTRAKLQCVSFRSADLRGAKLLANFLPPGNRYRAFLREQQLLETNLSEINLSEVTHSGIDFSGANLSGVSLAQIDLSTVDFSETNLTEANFNQSKVLNTNFTRAILSGACIADWQIGSSTILEGVKCDYIFRTYDTERKQFTGRLPVDPDSTFAQGEFTQRFQIIASALETIDITFTEGIDWQAFFQSFQELRERHPDEEISIQGMERKGDAFVVRLEVAAEVDKGATETEIKQLYARRLVAIEAQYEQRLQLQGARLEDAQRTIEVERQRNTELIGVIGIVAQNQGSKYDMRGAQFAGGFAETVQGDQYGGVINNYGQDVNDIVRLLTALRTWSQALPKAQQDDVLMELDALESDLNKPEKPEAKRLGKRLQKLIAAGTTAAAIASGAVTFSGNVNEFTDNVLELGEKIGLTREAIQTGPDGHQ